MLKPKTLDLGERAELGLRYLTGMVDPQRGNQPYWGVYFDGDCHHADHTRWDTSELPGSWVDAIILARNMTGSKDGRDAEESIKKLLLSHFGEGGLRYNAPSPWSPKVYASLHELGYILNGLVTWYLDEGLPEVRSAADRLIEGLWDVSIRETAGMGMMIPPLENAELGGMAPSPLKGGYCYFPHEVYAPGVGWEITSNSDVTFNSATLLASARYYEATGSPVARNLACGLSNYLMNYSRRFDYDGRFAGHFHATMWAVGGVLKYGILEGHRDAVEWAKKVYDWARTRGSSFGWFPEYVGIKNPKRELCETCCITDMIYIATLLAKAGYAAYWDDVERFARNQLVEQQLVHAERIPPPEGEGRSTEGRSCGDMRERARGGFWVFAYANDAPSFLSGCCCAMGPRGLYLVWDSIVDKRPDGVYVNLPLNRNSEWLDVMSHYPHRGEVELVIRDAPTVFVRLPEEWAGEGRSRIGAAVYVDGTARRVEWRGNYVKVDGLKPGQRVAVLHPLRREERTEGVGGREYRLTWRGSTVVGISPPGQVFPLYQRSEMDTESAPMVEEEPRPPLKAKIHW
ncbi:MAG: hypothetical protein ACUVXI_15240 [bacterium]